MKFWSSWELWQKMVFSLGCLIVLTFLYGFYVRLRNQRRLAKLTAIGPIAQAERGEVANAEQKKDIPFGICCLEKGVDVEGVWSSKANTPLQTPKSSAPSSPRLGPTTDTKATTSVSRQSRESRRSTSRARLEKRPKRTTKAQPEGIDHGETAAGLRKDASSSTHDTSIEQPESRKSPPLQTMRGRPAWQPHRYRIGHHSYSQTASHSMDLDRTSSAFHPDPTGAASPFAARMPKRSQSDTSEISSSILRLETTRQLGSNRNMKTPKSLSSTSPEPIDATNLSIPFQTISIEHLSPSTHNSSPTKERPDLHYTSNYSGTPAWTQMEDEGPSKSAQWPLTTAGGQPSQTVFKENAQAKATAGMLKAYVQNDSTTLDRPGSQALYRLSFLQPGTKDRTPSMTEPSAVEKAHSYESSPRKNRHSTSSGVSGLSRRNDDSRCHDPGFEVPSASIPRKLRKRSERNSSASSTQEAENKSQPRKLQKRRGSESQDLQRTYSHRVK